MWWVQRTVVATSKQVLLQKSSLFRRCLTSDVKAVYQERVDNKELTCDEHQLKVVQHLAQLGDNLVDYERLLVTKKPAAVTRLLVQVAGQ